jgi:hypothetical protein
MTKYLTFVLVLAACGDNNKQGGADGGPGDGSPDAPPAPPRAVVVAGDFTPGAP